MITIAFGQGDAQESLITGSFGLFFFSKVSISWQSLTLYDSYIILQAMSGYDYRFDESGKDIDQANHIGGIWSVFMCLSFVFLLFTGLLLFYHTFLIMSNQTTWEHSRRGAITYLKIYPLGILPFYVSIRENVKETFFHGNKCKDWELKQPYELKEIQGFNFCENELYSCC